MKKSLYLLAIMSLFSCSSKKEIKTDYEVTKNEDFTVLLDANHTTGYSWKWIKGESTKLVDSVSVNYLSNNEATEKSGVGGKESWIFKGKETGIDTLTFEYCRPWQKNSTVETKKITVKIK